MAVKETEFYWNIYFAAHNPVEFKCGFNDIQVEVQMYGVIFDPEPEVRKIIEILQSL